MNPNEPSKFNSLRLPSFDYASSGAYFITLVSCQRQTIFWEIHQQQIWLSLIGHIVKETWEEIPLHFPFVTLENYVIMPDHVHGILWIDQPHTVPPVAATHASQPQERTATPGPKPKSVSAIIGSFKSASTKRCHDLQLTTLSTLWQRNYYEHIIRDELELERVCDYIDTNPENWSSDSQILFPPS